MSADAKKYTIHDLSDAENVAPRTIHSWVKKGLLPPVPFRGAHTFYGPEHLLYIRAVKKLRADFLSIDTIRDRLSRATPQEIELIINPRDPSAPRPPPPEPSYPAEKWERVVLHPGLELLVRDEPAMRRLAQEIYTYFGPEKK